MLLSPQEQRRDSQRQSGKVLTVEIDAKARLIEAEGNARLRQSLYPELKHVTCTFRHGIITLYGVVSSFHIRQIAQELIQDLEGIVVIDNQLAVANDPTPPDRIRAFTSDGAATTGLEEPQLRKMQGDGRAGPASSDGILT
jgi:hypothetical protein